MARNETDAPSIAEMEEIRKKAKLANENNQTTARELAKSEEKYNTAENQSKIAVKLAIIEELEKERDEAARGSTDEIEDTRGEYNRIIRALKLKPEQSLTTSILETIIRVARETK